jgi:light-regulated signal transduction histidine kinase (bacteriophytochrome)
VQASPAFGHADLTNCERELIHLAGSVQPFGVLFTLQGPQFTLVQASTNTAALLGAAATALLGRPLDTLGGDAAARLHTLCASADLLEPVPLKCSLTAHGHAAEFEGTVHRVAPDLLVLELEPLADAAVEAVGYDSPQLLEHLGDCIHRFSAASNINALADTVVKRFRDLVGYDRVMVYKFDPDGHGKIIAEARNPRLESLLGHHYPATDIPQRARELYIRNRLRVLVDVNSEAAALVPRQLPGGHDELDMSLCHLRSMSPLHLQYLRNMGVTATLVISLVREGKLWGLIACHHYSPRNLRMSVRAACEMLAEVIATRIAAIENYVHAQVAIQVRRLEQRLIEATSTEGDWRLALFRNPHTLLQPLGATGAALIHEGEILTTGEVPSTPELRALTQWVHSQQGDGLFSCASVSRANPALDSLTPTASGVLAVKLSAQRADYLMWFRKEQLLTVTWAGDPNKQVVGNDPLELSPRRSFAAWSEIVRGTALAWTSAEIALARAFGNSLVDIILQVHAVRLLIAEHQLVQTRATVASSQEPVVIADATQRVLFGNDAFYDLVRRPRGEHATLDEMATLFTDTDVVRTMLNSLAEERQPWRGPLELRLGDGGMLAVAVRAEIVPHRDGTVLGYFLILDDLTQSRRAAAARERLEQSLARASMAAVPSGSPGADGLDHQELLNAVLANASLAAMDIMDGHAAPSLTTLLEEIDSSAQRATALYKRIRGFIEEA